MTVTVIIVNFNTKSLLINCLNSLFISLKKFIDKNEYEVIVVDNGSSDNSIEAVGKYYPAVRLIRNSDNLGFAKANNQGIRIARGKYILLLNSDTEVDYDTLYNLYKYIEENKQVGVVGCKLVGRDGQIQPSAGFFPSLGKVFFWMTFIDDLPYLNHLIKPYHVETKSFYESSKDVDWVTAACIMVRKEAIDNAGILDEKIFMYGEEMEWCYRIKKAGYAVAYTSEAETLHLKGASGSGENAGIIEEFKALSYFYNKHKPFWQHLVLSSILRFGALLRLVLFGIIGKYPKRIMLYAKAFQVVGR